MKIAIIGYSGSGKSTLAGKLGTIFQADVLHFDAVQFLPGWEIRPEEDKKKITKEFLDTHDSWVIDGNYSKLFYERRMMEADIIIMLLFNRFSCLYRVVRRYLKYKNKTRPDMGEGCNEKLDREFIRWVLYDQRTRQAKKRYAKVRSQYKEKVIIVKNQRQLDECLKKLSKNYSEAKSTMGQRAQGGIGLNTDSEHTKIEYTKIVLEPNGSLIEMFSHIRDDNIHVVFKEGLYFSGGTELDCFLIRKENVILEGEGDVVIYDNRGHMINAHPYPKQGSTLAHTVLIDARTVRISNITFVNGCNIDFRYKDIFLPKVSDTITQAYAFGGQNIDRLDIDNSKFYSILDTFSLGNVKEVNISNSYIQGNNDFIAVGERTYHYQCEFRNMGPCPMWAAADGYMIFDRCTFKLDDNVTELSFTKRGGNIAFLDSQIWGKAGHIRMEIEPKRESRYYLYHTTYNGSRASFEGFEESFIDLTDAQCLTVRNRQLDTLKLRVAGSRVIEGETILELSAVPDKVEVSDNVQYRPDKNKVTVYSDITGKDQEAYLDIYAGFLRQRVYLTVVGKKVSEPVLLRALTYKIEAGKLSVDYEVGHPDDILDLSYVDVYQEDSLLYSISPKDRVDILKSDVGKAFQLVLHAKTEETKEYVSEKLFTRNVCAGDVSTDIQIDDLCCYSLSDKNHFYTGKSVFTYKGDEVPNFVRFDDTADRPFTYSYGTDGAKGIQGLLYTGRGACFIYPIAEVLQGLTLEIDLAVEKSSGEGFGSANGQYLELFVNYDHETQSGTALRLEREACAGRGVFMSVREYSNGINRTAGEKIFTQLYKTYCRLSVRYAEGQLEFKLSHNGAEDSLKTVCGECMSSFMLRSSGTTGVGNRFLILSLKVEMEV